MQSVICFVMTDGFTGCKSAVNGHGLSCTACMCLKGKERYNRSIERATTNMW